MQVKMWFLFCRTDGGITTGSTIGVLLDFTRRILLFLINDEQQGPVAFESLEGAYFPAISLNRNVQVENFTPGHLHDSKLLHSWIIMGYFCNLQLNWGASFGSFFFNFLLSHITSAMAASLLDLKRGSFIDSVVALCWFSQYLQVKNGCELPDGLTAPPAGQKQNMNPY